MHDPRAPAATSDADARDPTAATLGSWAAHVALSQPPHRPVAGLISFFDCHDCTCAVDTGELTCVLVTGTLITPAAGQLIHNVYFMQGSFRNMQSFRGQKRNDDNTPYYFMTQCTLNSQFYHWFYPKCRSDKRASLIMQE